MNKQNDDAQVTCDQQPNTSNTFKHPVAKHGPSDLLQQTRGRFSRPIRVHSFRPRPSPEGFARESPGGSSVVLSVFLEGKTGSHELWKLPSSILPLHPPPWLQHAGLRLLECLLHRLGRLLQWPVLIARTVARGTKRQSDIGSHGKRAENVTNFVGLGTSMVSGFQTGLCKGGCAMPSQTVMLDRLDRRPRPQRPTTPGSDRPLRKDRSDRPHSPQTPDCA